MQVGYGKIFRKMCRKLQQVKDALNHTYKLILGLKLSVETLDHLC